MSAAKGFPTSDKIVTLNQSGVKNDYNTLQPTGSKRVSLDTVNRGVTQITAGLIVAAGSGNVPGSSPRIITTIASAAREGNVIRFTSGVLSGQEVAITRIINPTTFEIGMYLPAGIAGSAFTLLRYVTPIYDASGALAVAPPIGGATEAKQDVQIADFEAASPEYNATPPVYIDGDKTNLQTDANGRLLISTGVVVANPTVVFASFLDYAATNLTNTGWTEVAASIGATPVTQIQIFDSSGYTLQLGVGAVGAEIVVLLINPGGNGLIPINIPANSRISLRSAIQPTINVGESVINYVG